jgi:CRP-like cAMP-binding protein
VTLTDWLSPSVRAAGRERLLKAGESLFRMGGKTAGLYEIAKGKIRLVRIDASGREAVLYSAGPGQVIAEASLFSPVYHCDALASTNAVVRLYPKAAILQDFRRDPKAAQAFMTVLAREIMNLRTRLELCSIHSARDRLRHYLALNAGSDGRTVVLRGTVKELAADLGLTHEAMYRTLAAMREDGEIERAGNRITLMRSYDRDHT